MDTTTAPQAGNGTLLDPVKARIPAEWGRSIDCGAGWWPLIAELDTAITAIEPDYIVLQVKQKFGGLRYYWMLPDDADDPDGARRETVDALVRAAETRAAGTCEHCGQPGTMRTTRGWMATRCDPCAAQRTKHR